jgi:protein involved in polysaccharide export with SLBB domain
MAAPLFAASYGDGEQLPGQRQGGYSAAALSRDEALIKKLEESALQPEVLDNAATKKPSVVLKGEPGDGLIALNWVLLSKTDEQGLRFSIRFGTESDKYSRTIAVGSSTGYVLRELKNFQPYFIQVVALDRDQKTLFKSTELRIIPLPTEALGSGIEKAFFKTSPTLLETIEPERMRRELKQFGYDFFKNSLQLTSAIDAMPVGSQYMLGPGDGVSLTTWGSVNLRQELTVDRNGDLMIAKVGPVRVWGLPFDKAKTAVSEAMNRYFRNYEMSLTLGKLRTIQVYVVGEVEAPGNYPVSSLATVINALATAGGPSHNGSLRSVRVTRGAQTVATVDLYDMLLSGDRNKDVQLQNGDTIFVPVIGPVVAVAGEVRRPAIYELNGSTTISDVLKMAGGVAATGSLGRIQVERLENNTGRIALDFVPKGGSLTAELATVELKDRDMVKIFPVQAAIRQVVVVKGNIQQAGEYQFRPGMRLTDLIPSSQVLLPESYMDSVEITRIAPPDYQRELITVSLRRALAGNQTDNLLLQEQDTVRVFSRWEMEEKPRVAVNGAVVNPGPYDYFPGMSVRDLVTAAGSAKRNAFLDQAELSRTVISGDKAEAKRFQLDLGKALAGDTAHNLLLQSDDVLIVRGVTDWQDSTDKFVTLSGEVRFPGLYSVARGEKLSSVIARAGGYTEKSYLRGARFTRRSVREMQQKRMDEISIKSERDILQKQSALAAVAASKEELDATKSALEALQRGAAQLKNLRAEGRVVIHLSESEDLKESSNDVTLEGGDVLEIPMHPSVVSVLGQVYNPNSFVFQAGHDIGWYLDKTGGAVADAEKSEMYVVRADGTVFSRQQSFFGSFLSTSFDAGDTLVVPQKLERIAWLREIKDWSQILANVALTAGTVMLGLR